MTKIFFAVLFLNAFLWILIVPIWHTPDEQAHFAQVAFLAEKGRNPEGKELDLTEEILISERLLGTERDKLGNNKFTFHPEYRIEYTDSVIGKYEAKISALANTELRGKFVKQEASRYPLLYYLPAALIYRLFYIGNLFTRVFAVRFYSLFLFIANVYVCFLLGKLIFPKDKLSAITLPILVGFQPMMVFANVGVGSDSLGNFLFTLFLYFSLKLIRRGLKKEDLLEICHSERSRGIPACAGRFQLSEYGRSLHSPAPYGTGLVGMTGVGLFKQVLTLVLLVFTVLLCLYTKPQFIISLPLLILVLIFINCRDFSKKRRHQAVLGIIVGFLIFLFILFKLSIGSFSLINRFLNNLNFQSLIKFTREYTFPHTYKEVMPWYWGIYDWLGVTYPRWAHRIINRLVLIAGFGFLVWIYKVIKEKRWRERWIQGIVFLLISQLVFFLAISIYDWLSWYYSQKYPLGVQGRYFFPLISAQMLVLLLGWRSLFPSQWKLKQWGVKMLAVLMIFLNFYALYTVAKTYYDLFSFSTFIIQVSQYKPWFLKGNWLILSAMVYVITMTGFLVKYIGYKNEKISEIKKKN